jgi:hypothetical protein
MIFNSVVLEVAIGLFLVFFAVAVICSGLNELIAGVVSLRARYLRKGINSILNDNAALVKSFYESPLIKGLSQSNSREPSYIPANVFARVLRDIITPGAASLPPRTWNEVLAGLLEKLSSEPDEKLSPVERELLGVLQTAGLDQKKLASLVTLTDQLAAARKALGEFAARRSESDTAAGQFLTQQVVLLETSVQQIEEEVGSALERAQTNVETYFNDVMDRVSGWYKQVIQLVIVILAVAITLLFNVDTFAIINNLMEAPVVRAALIDMATEVQSTADQAEMVRELDTMRQLGIPIGWDVCTMPGALVRDNEAAADCAESLQTRSTIQWWLAKLAGLAVTVAAASLGAPFWFDLLNKVVNLRLAGQKPAEDQR